jgi:hypothetical protein
MQLIQGCLDIIITPLKSLFLSCIADSNLFACCQVFQHYIATTVDTIAVIEVCDILLDYEAVGIPRFNENHIVVVVTNSVGVMAVREF